MSWSPLHRLSSGLDQAFADRVKRGLRAVDDADLLVDVADMVPHRLLADPQPVRDLLVSKPAGHQLEDLDLARGHAVRRLGDNLQPIVVPEQPAQAHAEERVVVGDHDTHLSHERPLASAGRGRVTRTLVPPPGTESMSRRAPIRIALSLMPVVPMPST